MGRHVGKNDVEIFEFFDLTMKHSKKLICMDGDVSQRSLSLAPMVGWSM